MIEHRPLGLLVFLTIIVACTCSCHQAVTGDARIRQAAPELPYEYELSLPAVNAATVGIHEYAFANTPTGDYMPHLVTSASSMKALANTSIRIELRKPDGQVIDSFGGPLSAEWRRSPDANHADVQLSPARNPRSVRFEHSEQYQVIVRVECATSISANPDFRVVPTFTDPCKYC